MLFNIYLAVVCILPTELAEVACCLRLPLEVARVAPIFRNWEGYAGQSSANAFAPSQRKLFGASGSTSGRRKSKRYKSDRTRHLSGEHREQPAWSLLKVWDRQPHPWLSEMAVSEKNSFEPVWLLLFFFGPVSSWSKKSSRRVQRGFKEGPRSV